MSDNKGKAAQSKLIAALSKGMENYLKSFEKNIRDEITSAEFQNPDIYTTLQKDLDTTMKSGFAQMTKNSNDAIKKAEKSDKK